MTRRGVKLIAPNRDGILLYQGNCKIIIDCIMSKMLKVEPKNEEFPDISVMFEWKWKFIQKENLLFIFAENNIQDFVLIFANQEICKKVHNVIYKNKKEDSIEKEELQQRFLNPIFQIISKNECSKKFKKIMRVWNEKLEGCEKMEFLKLTKKHENINPIMLKNIKQEFNTESSARKRPFNEMENANEEMMNIGFKNVECGDAKGVPSKKKKVILSVASKIIDKSKFKIVNVKSGSGLHRKLLIFTSSKKTKCYEYYYHSKKQIFNHRCHEGAHGFKAILKLDENGNECIKFEVKEHVCSPLKYDRKSYFEIKIIKKPDYEILENCGTRSKRMLIIFNPNNRSKCYEYFWKSSFEKFQCRGCALKKKLASAEIIHENTESEYIRILNNKHFCEIRNYRPKKFCQTKKTILSPNFEIQTRFKDEIERKILIIFDESNRNLCYTYYFGTSSKIFYCNGCSQNGKNVTAKICQNSNGEDFVELSNSEHICTLQKYIPRKEIFLRPPKFKFMESNEKYTSKIFVFDSNDTSMCYIFSQCSGANSKRYYCLGCRNLIKPFLLKNEGKQPKEITVYLYKDDDNDGYYVKVNINQKHICEPQKYDPEKYETKKLKPNDDYILFREKGKNKSFLSLAIYDPKDKNLCYTYSYQKSSKLFICFACQRKGKTITAKLQQDSDGNEYIIPNQKKHVCSSIKYSSIIKSDTVILEKSGLIFEETKKKKEINESKIVRKPNFELHKNKYGVAERKLIVFYNNERNLCYEYEFEKNFKCKKCQIIAKLHVNSENDEKFIVLSENEHKCKPVKYEAEKKIIESPNFLVYNRDDSRKPTKLIIFTTSIKEKCYEYTLLPRDQYFRCCGCFAAVKKNICAKLLKDSNGKEYVQLLKNEHFCEPKKYILEEFQPKIILQNEFILCPNKNGKPNSKVIILDPAKNGFGYEYYDEHKNFFTCIHCIKKNKRVTAKLCEKEDGEKYLELSIEGHACKSVKYDSVYKENQKNVYQFCCLRK